MLKSDVVQGGIDVVAHLIKTALSGPILGKLPHTLIAAEQGENELDYICWYVVPPRLKMFRKVDEKGRGFLAGSANTGRVWS